MRKQEKWLRAAFSKDAELPESMESRLSQAYDQIRQESRGKEPAMKRTKTEGRMPRRTVRTILIAAAIVAAFTVSALAVYQYSLSDRLIETNEREDGSEYATYSIYGSTTESAEDESEMEAAINGTVELQAYLEYEDLIFNHQMDLNAVDLLDYSDSHRAVYGLGYGVLADALDEIAEKYDLQLIQANVIINADEDDPNQAIETLCEYLGISSFGLEAEEYDALTDNFWCSAEVCDDGSFNAVHVSAGLDTAIDGMNVYRIVKGSLGTFSTVSGEIPADCEEECYTTASGVSVWLALGPSTGLLFAELDTCYIACETYCGAEDGVAMENMESLAELIDFAALDSIDSAAVSERVMADYQYADGEAASDPRVAAALEVYDQLGDYELDIDRESYTVTTGAESVEDSLNTLWADLYGGCYISAIKTYYSGDWNQEFSLYYARYWADEEQTALANQDAYDAQKLEYMEADSALNGEDAFEITDCTVNGYEAYIMEEFEGSWVISWYDTDNEIVFNLHVSTDYTADEALALAEGVALAE
ncbi:MAG: hypothetical protein LUH42_07010 [Oscillospiraceae bacterium]|nr:hypothetical protein [Oscillospiraceae bacterium]